MKKFFLLIPAVLLGLTLSAQADLKALIDQRAAAIESKVIQWRRHFHENPELSNREFKTAEIVEKHLRSLGLEVRTKIAYTGVVGILKGGKPGPVVALRADMDALPVTERVNIPFASKVKATYLDQEVGVMHACGHDTHMAMLMGAAEVLAGMREQIPGTIVFIFQPAEEGPPRGEEGGAEAGAEHRPAGRGDAREAGDTEQRDHGLHRAGTSSSIGWRTGRWWPMRRR